MAIRVADTASKKSINSAKAQRPLQVPAFGWCNRWWWSNSGKIVCVRNKGKRKDWLAIISTDTAISAEEIIRIYGKRWDIEVFFKTCKSYLHLVKECRSLSYDALTAHVSIVFARYMMLAVTQRCNTDDKTICELFFRLMDELDDITFSQSMRIIIDALMGVVMEYFHITEQQLEKLTASFVQRLPKYMQKSIEYGSAAAWLLFYDL